MLHIHQFQMQVWQWLQFIGTQQTTNVYFYIGFIYNNKFWSIWYVWLNRGKEYDDYSSPYAFKKFSGLAKNFTIYSINFAMFYLH